MGLGISLALNGLLILKVLEKISMKNQQDTATEEHIRNMAETCGEIGTIHPLETEMIHNIFDLSKTAVGNIATHRKDIVAVQDTATLEEITEIFVKEKYSRILVYKENIDDIVGLLHVQDILKYNTIHCKTKPPFSLERLLKRPVFVPFSKRTNELFQEMQKKKVHIAIIIDEYGGTAGMVTMEDMIEEIVGNIFDEYDLVEEEMIKNEDGTYYFSGACALKDVSEELDIVFMENEDYDTLGGYLVGQLGRIPEEDEVIEIFIEDWIFYVEKVEEKRIEGIKAIPNIVTYASE